VKYHLLSTSALALGAVLAHPAAAQEWNLDWGGFYNQHVAFGDISVGPVLGPSATFAPGADPEGDGLDLHGDAEIIFTPNITLDNGLTFGATVQLEALQSGTEIDETFITISGDNFGRLDVGAENSAGYKSMVAAPIVTTAWINSPSTSSFIPFTGTGTALAFRQAALSTYAEVLGNNDVQRITYYTPDFNGLTVGLSYAPTGAVNAANSFSVNKNAVLSDIWDIGVNYSQSLGKSADITLSARYGEGDAPIGLSDPDAWGVGFQVGFSNFTVGGSYNENDNGAAAGAAGANVGDQEGWSFGATYDAAGPWAFEALTYQGTADDWSVFGADLEREAYRIGANRDLGPGVSWDVYVIYEERDDEATPGVDVEGTLLGTAINLGF